MFVKDYALDVLEKSKHPYHPLIQSIGHEKRESSDSPRYHWDCKQNAESVCIFQYTVSGRGEVCINKKVYKQNPGDVFLIERPGPYKYYLPEDSDHWEFKFINFSFSAMPFWNPIVSTFGHVVSLHDEDCEVMRLFNEIFDTVESSLEQNEINGKTIYSVKPFDTFLENSMQAFRFLNTLHRYLLQNGTTSDSAESVQLCIEYIRTHYSEHITSLDIAQAGFISPYYLNKRFKEVVGETPLQYLTKIRLQNAITMLKNTDANIDQIARQCGFQSANYFTKVYKKYTGITPSDYRREGGITTIL